MLSFTPSASALLAFFIPLNSPHPTFLPATAVFFFFFSFPGMLLLIVLLLPFCSALSSPQGSLPQRNLH